MKGELASVTVPSNRYPGLSVTHGEKWNTDHVDVSNQVFRGKYVTGIRINLRQSTKLDTRKFEIFLVMENPNS